jgi:hypothetical protein
MPKFGKTVMEFADMDERSLELVLIVAIGAAAFLLLRFVFRDRLNQFYANNRRGRLIAGGVAAISGIVVYRLIQFLVN